MDEQQKAALAAALSGLSEQQLDALDASARRTLAALEDANSAFPATQEFLQSRGLTNVRQLDKQGMQDLREHLERTLQALCKAKA
jgi:hypothetical protein